MKLACRLFFLPLLCVFFCGQAYAIDPDEAFFRERMLGDLEFIRNTIEGNYACLDLKREKFGFNLEAEVQKAQDRIVTVREISTHDFHTVLKKLFHSFKDYHATLEFYSTESATLPFFVQSVKNRYFFTHIQMGKFPEDQPFPFETGDELLSIDKVPVHKIAKRNIFWDIGHNQPATDQALADLHLTTRLGELGQSVPKGKVILTGLKKNSESPIEYVMEWDYIPEIVGDFFLASNKSLTPTLPKEKMRKKSKRLAENNFFKKQFVLPQYKALKAVRTNEDDEAGMLGAKKGNLPLLGKVIWEVPSTSCFHAYLFEMNEGTVGGYLRIASYIEDDMEKAATDFAEIVKVFQDDANVVVIDQTNNPGGSALYTYALVSMLTDAPLNLPLHRQMIMQEDIYFAFMEFANFESVQDDAKAKELLGNTLEGMPVSHELVKALSAYMLLLIEEWSKGSYFTQPLYMFGLGPLPPHPEVHYTKPLLVLVNELDFSGADFFPAILQDNGRATIMGTKTAGAGGAVSKVSFPNLNGIKSFSYTSTIAERPGNVLIENVGVTPDIIYEVSEADLQSNYADYVQVILKALYNKII